MNKSASFLLLALAMATSATAAQRTAHSNAQRITVDQLSQLLQHRHGENDSKLARRLSALQLSERPDSATLAQWQAESPGEQSRLALTELADGAAFLDPPSSQMVDLPPPGNRELQLIILRTVEYVKNTVPRLPDFYALRTTTQFEATPVRALDWPDFCRSPKSLALGSGCLTIGGAPSRLPLAGIGPLRETGETGAVVTYRDGKEADSERTADAVTPLKFLGLVTSGEYGAILSMVLGDAVRGEVSWGYWEKPTAHPLAVFRYTVPSQYSHYEVDYPSETGPENFQPAYHGEIAIDPAAGTIWRISVVSDLDAPHQDVTTAITVEYGPMMIGGMLYTCPVRGVAYSKVPVFTRRNGRDIKLPTTQTRLNDIRFTGYHVFRGDMKILPDADPNPALAASPMPAPAR